MGRANKIGENDSNSKKGGGCLLKHIVIIYSFDFCSDAMLQLICLHKVEIRKKNY